MRSRLPGMLTTVRYACADSGTMFRRSARHTLRGRDILLISLAMPILVMLMFTYVFGGAIAVGGPYLDYVVPGIMLLCVGFGSSITATSVSTDMTTGSIDRFRTLPMFRPALLMGHVLEGVVRNLAAIAIAVGVAVVLGYRPGAGPLGWLAALMLIGLFVFALSWIAVALGLMAANPEAAGGLTYAIMFIPYISSAFVRTDTMPGWLRGFAEHQPATPVVETVRTLLATGTTHQAAGLAVGWCLGLLLVGFLAAQARFVALDGG